MSNSRWFLRRSRTFLYVASGITSVWVFTMKNKDYVRGIFLKWKAQVENQTGTKIKVLRTNNGRRIQEWSVPEGMWRLWHSSTLHCQKTPQQNGVSKRMNKTLEEKVRCMLSNVELGKKFWAKAVTYAQHLVNRLPIFNRWQNPVRIMVWKTCNWLWFFACFWFYCILSCDWIKVGSTGKEAFFHGL